MQHVLTLAKKHAADDFKRDRATACSLDASAVNDLASEGFWNVVFPKLENEGIDPETEVNGATIEKHYITALEAAYRELQAKHKR